MNVVRTLGAAAVVPPHWVGTEGSKLCLSTVASPRQYFRSATMKQLIPRSEVDVFVSHLMTQDETI